MAVEHTPGFCHPICVSCQVLPVVICGTVLLLRLPPVSPASENGNCVVRKEITGVEVGGGRSCISHPAKVGQKLAEA